MHIVLDGAVELNVWYANFSTGMCIDWHDPVDQ
jgi:hypothetical protein